tara:strand:- start:79 stop:285 length:207 start_codon:yes stop_codon:yes gene_type:complete
MTAEQILIELLEKLNHDITESNAYVQTSIPEGQINEYECALIDVNKDLIKWIEKRVEVKKSVIIKENK